MLVRGEDRLEKRGNASNKDLTKKAVPGIGNSKGAKVSWNCRIATRFRNSSEVAREKGYIKISW